MDAADRVPNFPILTEDEVRAITFGVYQVHQAKLYADEHLKEEGKYLVSKLKLFIWVASCKRVPKILSQYHTKRKMGIGMTSPGGWHNVIFI